MAKNRLTCFFLFNFFRRHGENEKHLYHDFYDRAYHSCIWRDLDVCFESLEKALDALKNTQECVLARPGSIGHLAKCGSQLPG